MKIDFRLYCISPGNAGAVPLEDTIIRAAKAGAKAFQLREKHLPDDEFRALAIKIAALLKPFSAFLFLNNFLNSREMIAEELGLHVHLPEQNIHEIEGIRRARGESVLIGASTHSLESAKAAERAGADLILFGPVFETESKKKFGSPQGVERLKTVCGEVKLPVFAIGGITPERAKECRSVGAHGVACISAVMEAPDVGLAVQQFGAVL
ncbi:MAG TPA: thiamine phosphate synthase [Candidatus Kapabacteria bacterium]|nr:thiamine phosphate synthase [Candidatus Kapabacteria bacterium]